MNCIGCKREVARLTLNKDVWLCRDCYIPEYVGILSFSTYDVKTGNLTAAHAKDIKSRRIAEDGKTVIRTKYSTNVNMPSFVPNGYKKNPPNVNKFPVYRSKDRKGINPYVKHG